MDYVIFEVNQMKIDAWFKLIEKESTKYNEDVEWFKERTRQKFIYKNELLSAISLGQKSNC